MDMLGNRIIWHVVDQYDITEEEAFGLIGGDSAYSLTGRTKMRWCEVCHLRIATYEPTSADGTMHEACARRSAQSA
jgi:hypothetical protein